MSDPSARTFNSDFKRFFLRGLVILLPSVLTLWIVVKAYQFVDSAIAQPINRGIQVGMINIAPHISPLRNKFDPTLEQLNSAVVERAVARGLASRDADRTELRKQGIAEPTEVQINAAIAQRAEVRNAIDFESVRTEMRSEAVQRWWSSRWYMDLIGLIVAIIAVYFTGYLLGGFLGRGLYKHFERLITTLPVFKQVYPYVKQIVDFLFKEKKDVKFNSVVLVEYPRKGIWSIGFQTGGTMDSIQRCAGDCVSVFIPSSPTPFTGYTITVPRSEVLELPITVEEAVRFVVSGGVLIPDRQQIPVIVKNEAVIDTRTVVAGAIASNASEKIVVTNPANPVAVHQDSGSR